MCAALAALTGDRTARGASNPALPDCRRALKTNRSEAGVWTLAKLNRSEAGVWTLAKCNRSEAGVWTREKCNRSEAGVWTWPLKL